MLRVYAFTAIVLLPITSFLALRSRAGVDPASAAGAVGTDVATRAVETWAEPLGATSLVWLSATSSPTDDGASVETHLFGIVIDGVAHHVAVQIAAGADGVRWVLSDPSIEVVPDAGATNNRVPLWPGAERYNPSQAVHGAVEAWATAYFSGDATQLRNVTRDPTSGNTYIPVSGYDPADVVVGAGAAHPDGVIVRATITLTEPPLDPDDDSTVPAAFDLLIAQHETAAPAVIAWGPPGTGLTLVPYGNAVTNSATAPTTAAAATADTTPPPPGSDPPIDTGPPADNSDPPMIFNPNPPTTTP